MAKAIIIDALDNKFKDYLNNHLIFGSKVIKYLEDEVNRVLADIDIYCDISYFDLSRIDMALLFKNHIKGKICKHLDGLYTVDSNVEFDQSKAVDIQYVYIIAPVTNMRLLAIKESLLAKRIANNLLDNDVYIENTNTVSISVETSICPKTKILSGTCIYGVNRIDENNIIGPNTTLINTIIGQNNKIEASYIESSIILNNTQIGPYAHIRNNSIINDNTRVGNFVEIKNSSFGTGSKTAHLTYIGDSSVGENVNFGCGTVTVNYDGVNKNRTVIGDNVFIGCNSNLIAPINIASNSFIAAGSTVTESTEDSDFVIARTRQTTKKGYAKKYKRK